MHDRYRGSEKELRQQVESYFPEIEVALDLLSQTMNGKLEKILQYKPPAHLKHSLKTKDREVFYGESGKGWWLEVIQPPDGYPQETVEVEQEENKTKKSRWSAVFFDGTGYCRFEAKCSLRDDDYCDMEWELCFDSGYLQYPAKAIGFAAKSLSFLDVSLKERRVTDLFVKRGPFYFPGSAEGTMLRHSYTLSNDPKSQLFLDGESLKRIPKIILDFVWLMSRESLIEGYCPSLPTLTEFTVSQPRDDTVS